MRRTRIKICGITDERTLRAAVICGADMVGFVLAEGSPRAIDIHQLQTLLPLVPLPVLPVAVVRNAPSALLESIEQIGDRRLVVQFHGSETIAEVTRHGRDCIRAIPFDPHAITAWEAHSRVRMLLIDGAQPGSGERFDHAALATLRPRLVKPLALAGGLDPENVAEAIDRVRPDLVDVSSGVESAPGVKDPARIEAFFRAVAKTW